MKPDKIIELNMDNVMRQALRWNAGLLAAFAALYHVVAEPLSFRFSFSAVIFFIGGYIALIILHEAFHLLGFIIFGRVPLSSLNYGVNLEMGIAYATTDRPLRNRAMKKALLLPFWITGVLPAIFGFYVENQTLVLLGALLVAGAIGDFLMYRELIKEDGDAWILDSPDKPMLYVYYEYPDSKNRALHSSSGSF